jgi:ribosomal protein S18 acetylase RimI-like enzyme
MNPVHQDVAIRPALAKDITAIRNVAGLAWSAAYGRIIPHDIQGQAIASWYSQEALLTAVEARESLFLLAERGEILLGFISLYQRSPVVVHLARIYLLPKEQRKGLGARLLRAALELMPDSVETATVEVEERNYAARAFYERCGFRVTGATTADLFGFHLPLIRYQKTLGRGAA